jgi:hypothetical protein
MKPLLYLDRYQPINTNNFNLGIFTNVKSTTYVDHLYGYYHAEIYKNINDILLVVVQK